MSERRTRGRGRPAAALCVALLGLCPSARGASLAASPQAATDTPAGMGTDSETTAGRALARDDSRADAPSPVDPPVDPSATEPGVVDPSAAEPGVVDPSAAEPGVVDPSAGHRALALGAAFVPGLLVHGAGNFVLQRKQTALRLLLLQGIGLGLLGLGGTVIATTGAARDFVGPAAALTMLGGGLFTLSAAADIYGVLAPPGGLGLDPGWVPQLEAELGYRAVYDPQFAHRHFLVNGLKGRAGAFRLAPSVWSSPDTANQRLRVEFAYRFLGAQPGTRRTDGNFVEAEVAYTDHRFGFEDFALRTVETSVAARWDLGTYDPFLAGSFLDFAVGVGNQLYFYGSDLPGPQSFTLLLGRFGFGVFLGDQWPLGGYVRAYYDHRHDGFAAGLLTTGLGSGVIGHFGLDGVYYFSRNWGLRAEAQIGAAAVAGLSGLFRYGGDP